MATMIHTYTGKARETYDRVLGDNLHPKINKWYLNREHGIIYKVNSKGYLHVLVREHYKINHKIYYHLGGMRLTDMNMLHGTNYSTPTFKDKQEFINYLEELVGEPILGDNYDEPNNT